VCFKLYLSNWMIDRFEIHSVARSKVAIMIPGFNLIFSKCGMCWVFAQQVTFKALRAAVPVVLCFYLVLSCVKDWGPY